MPSKDLAKIAFTKLQVGNLERAAAFYEAVCGYEDGKIVTGHLAGRPMREMVYQDGSGATGLILLALDDEPNPSPGKTVVGFSTKDMDGAVKRTLAAGGAIVSEVRMLTYGEATMKIAFLADNEGHILEFIER